MGLKPSFQIALLARHHSEESCLTLTPPGPQLFSNRMSCKALFSPSLSIVYFSLFLCLLRRTFARGLPEYRNDSAFVKFAGAVEASRKGTRWYAKVFRWLRRHI